MNSSKRQPIKAGDIVYPFHILSPYSLTAPKQLYIGMALEDEKDVGTINFLSLHLVNGRVFPDILEHPGKDLVNALTLLKSLLGHDYNPRRLDALFFKQLEAQGIAAQRGQSLNNYSYPVDPAYFKPLDSLDVFQDLVIRSEHSLKLHLSRNFPMTSTQYASLETFLSRKHMLEYPSFRSLISSLVSLQCKARLPVANLHLPSDL